VVHVPYRPNVHVRLRPLEFAFRHDRFLLTFIPEVAVNA